MWDVGHQAYPHKLLTGRRDRFNTIRQYGGLSGFLSRDESVHDAFGAGHASTSISAAYGMAVARDLKGEHNHVVAVIGDGAMTGGMAYEALNNAGNSDKPFIVILNDNEMSIAPNVGALSKYLYGVRTDPRYESAKDAHGECAGPCAVRRPAPRFRQARQGLGQRVHGAHHDLGGAGLHLPRPRGRARCAAACERAGSRQAVQEARCSSM